MWRFVARSYIETAVVMKSNAVLPKLPAAPILPAAFTVGRLLQSSGVSLAGEYQIDIPLDVPPSRAGMAPTLSLTYSSIAENPNGVTGDERNQARNKTSTLIRMTPFTKGKYGKRTQPAP